MEELLSIDRTQIFTALIGFSLFLLIIPSITYAYFATQLKSKESIMNNNDTGVVLLDRDGTPFFNLFEAKNKVFVPISDIPKSTQEAVIAIEDKDFYSHSGFSLKAILRSLKSNIQEQQLAYGGSTITQQLVKNALLTPQKSFLRKYQEVILAYEIERRYPKEEILEMYLNSVYFGNGAFGIEQASQAYFGKSAKNLDLAESSFLAGILKAPSQLSPYSGNLDGAKGRQQEVLDRMVQQGFITISAKDQAESEKLSFKNNATNANSLGIHFALMVRNQLVQKYGEETVSRSGFRVKTTLDLSKQQYGEKIVADQVKRLAPNRVTNGAAVVIDPKTGEILVWVGSWNWHEGTFGKVDIPEMPRQPGSSFKPIVYSVALEKGLITPATILHDSPVTYNNAQTGYIPYKPVDYDRKFRGDVTVRRALSNSLNVPAVEVMSKVGVADTLEMAHRLGITTLNDTSSYGLALVLGAGEVRLVDMATVYGTLANSGVKNDPVSVLEIQDKLGQPIYTFEPDPQSVLDPGVAFLISSILSDNNARQEAFGNALDNVVGAAVKTGTTENYRDAWTMGYTPSLVVGAWVGNNDGTTMDNIAGSLGAAPIWRSLMEKFLADKPIEKFTQPANILTYYCRFNTKDNKSATFSEYFLKNTPTPGFCSSSLSSLPTLIPVSGTPTPTPSPTSPTPTFTPTPTSIPSPTKSQLNPPRGGINSSHKNYAFPR